MMGTRARLTPVDVVYIAVSIAVLSFSVPVLYEVMGSNSDLIPTGSLYLFQLITPVLVLTILSVTFIVAVGGGN